MLRTLLCWVLVVVAACTPARREAEGNIVRHVRFEGNEGLLSGQNDYQLRSEMQQRSTGFGVATWPLIYIKDPEVLRNELLPRDAYRLEVWYAHHGWLDAQVLGWELRKVREPHPKRAGVLDIRGLVAPGEPSVVRTLEIKGTGKALTAVVRAVEGGAPIRVGEQFDLELVEQTRALLLEKLKNQARAYATAELSIDAHPEDNAVDVVLTVDPGPVCRFGEVTVEGNEIIPTALIEQRLKVNTGDGYKLDDIRATQQALFEMGTFSVATVQPDLSDRSVTEVPIRVQVTESKFRSLRFGAGASYDGFLFQPRVSTRIRHVNLFRSLVRAELGARAGFAYGVTGGSVTTSLPTYGVDLSFTYPRIAQQRVAIELRGEFEQDVFSGLWAYRRPQADLGVQWRYSDDVTVRAGPHVEQYTFISQDDPRRIENAQRRLFGIEGAGEDLRYQLTALDQTITWDYRNDKLLTTRGSYFSVSVREAIPLSDAGYFFVRPSAEARGWVPLKVRRRGTFPIVLAGKLRGTVIVPLGDKNIPVPERAYLGGANSLRGFRPNQVGPYTTLCTVEEYETNGSLFGFGGGETETVERVQLFHLPEGGNLALETSVELRYDWIYGINLATFVDAGVLTPSLFEPAEWLDGFRASAGVGARYETLVGPLRFDLSFRPLYPEDDGPLRYAGGQCDPVDENPRVYDFFSNFQGLRGDAHPPLAMVFFLTIGEAF